MLVAWGGAAVGWVVRPWPGLPRWEPASHGGLQGEAGPCARDGALAPCGQGAQLEVRLFGGQINFEVP